MKALFYSGGIIIFLLLLFMGIYEYKEAKKEYELNKYIDCYDKYDSKIIGETCIAKSPDVFMLIANIALGLFFLFIFFILAEFIGELE